MVRSHFYAWALAGAVSVFGAAQGIAQESLPAKFKDDPVAKALGPAVFNAALKEGKVVWYGGTTTDDFLKKGGKKRFEDRFGIKIEHVTGGNDTQAQRVATEAAVGRVSVDIFDASLPHLFFLAQQNSLVKWRPPAPELDRIKKEVFIDEPPGVIWPTHISSQALIVNTKLVKPEDEPKSYWDIVNPKWKGKVAMRDPRSASGGAWQMMTISLNKTLGMDYLKKLQSTVEPFILRGGSRVLRDAIVNGQFAIGFSGRGEFIQDVPKGTPIKYVVPKEGMSWIAAGISLLAKSPNPNAAKVVLTWFYEVPQLQLWTDTARPVPHPDVKVPIPEMSVSAYPLMQGLPLAMQAKPDDFLVSMEKTFGVR